MLRPRSTGETVRVDDDCFWRKDGTKFRVAYSSAPLPQRDGRGAVVVFRDVTARLDAEEAARRGAVERARAQEIHDSRARIVEATDAERRRLTRDLHDGAQQRLVRVLFALRLAADELGEADAETRELLDQAAAETESAIVELRELANGIHPAILTNRGLRSAVESLTARAAAASSTLDVIPERFGRGARGGGLLRDRRGPDERLKHARGERGVRARPRARRRDLARRGPRRRPRRRRRRRGHRPARAGGPRRRAGRHARGRTSPVGTGTGCASSRRSGCRVMSARSIVSTAITRRCWSGSSPRPSLLNMPVTCFSTAAGVTPSSSAMPWLDLPFGHQREHLRSRPVRSSIGVVAAAPRRPSAATTSGSSAEPPSATRRTDSRNESTSATRDLSR